MHELTLLGLHLSLFWSQFDLRSDFQEKFALDLMSSEIDSAEILGSTFAMNFQLALLALQDSVTGAISTALWLVMLLDRE